MRQFPVIEVRRLLRAGSSGDSWPHQRKQYSTVSVTVQSAMIHGDNYDLKTRLSGFPATCFTVFLFFYRKKNSTVMTWRRYIRRWPDINRTKRQKDLPVNCSVMSTFRLNTGKKSVWSPEYLLQLWCDASHQIFLLLVTPALRPPSNKASISSQQQPPPFHTPWSFSPLDSQCSPFSTTNKQIDLHI